MELFTERMRLVSFAEADTDWLVSLSARPTVMTHIGTGEPWSREWAETIARQAAG